VVIGVKPTTEESGVMYYIRKIYYGFITKIADVELIKNFTGFGLYDRDVMDQLRQFDVSYPYFRGLISEIGYPIKRIPYFQPLRKNGASKYSIYNLYQVAALGITSHSLIPLRMATFIGFFISIISFFVAVTYLILKLLYWDNFPLGIASILISVFFFASIQLFFIGVLGEYIGAILMQTRKRPMVVEQERVNF
jgi:glycosyltransferase involved in cell wall biosynthesis